MGSNKEELVKEVRKQLGLAWPLVVSNLLLNALGMISVMFVGHLGELALSGASMAASFAGFTGFGLIVSACMCFLSLPPHTLPLPFPLPSPPPLYEMVPLIDV